MEKDMENINIGIANWVISNKLKNSYLNDNLIEESKKTVLDFFDVVKNSPILQLEFKVFNNIENKYIDNDTTATRYIDNNIKLFEIYTITELIDEHKKLNTFLIDENISLDNKKNQLYNSIDVLIKESINNYDNIDVDKIHECFTYVLNYIKEPKIKINENIDSELINDEVIEIAVDNFNEKYSSLNEEDKNLIQSLVKSNKEDKKSLLESYKKEDLSILENLNKTEVKENITKAIEKINNMKYNQETIVDDIISLHELKKELI